MKIDYLLMQAIEKRASDLHISAGAPPIIRLDGDLINLDASILSNNDLNDIIEHICTHEQQKIFKTQWENDFSYTLKKKARFRVNMFRQTKGCALVFRIIPHAIPNFKTLALPKVIKDLCQLPHGLVLITGPTGCGKSTTLASIIEHINQTLSYHIITIEDPIEFIYQNQRCLVHQREVKKDTLSFNTALRSALREDPDIILIGELRDLETIRLALSAAETGHLVFGTLHTNSAAKTIDRLVSVFYGEEKGIIRSMLSESLQAVIAQTLIKRKDKGRIAAQEIMRCIPAIRHLIRENKIAQIPSIIQTGKAHGMQTIEQHIQKLQAHNII